MLGKNKIKLYKIAKIFLKKKNLIKIKKKINNTSFNFLKKKIK